MIHTELASKYARALLQTGGSKEATLQHLHDLEGIVEIFARPEIKLFFVSPQVDQGRKQKILDNALPSSIDQEVRYFLHVLLQKRRFKYLPDIVKEYKYYLHESLDKLEVKLFTATPADSKILSDLERKLSQRFRKKIDLRNEIHHKLIGGGVLLIGDQMVDFSLRSKLNQLKEDLLSINV